MTSKNKVLFGIYGSQSDVEDAVSQLKVAGFRNTDISLLYPENEGTKDLALNKSTKAAEGAVSGAALGLVVVGALGWFIATGLIVVPYTGIVVAAGPVMSLLGGIGAGGVVGGLIGALIGLAMPRYEVKRYQGRVRKGSILMSVHCDDSDWAKTARMILDQTGAEHMAITHEARADFAASDRPRQRIVEKTSIGNRNFVTRD